MFCSECGSMLSEDAKFCHKCGAEVSIEDVYQEVPVSSNNIQRWEESILPEKQHQSDAVMNEQNIEPTSALEDNENFKEFVNKHVRETTKFQSAEELINSQVSSRFTRICYGIPSACALCLFIKAIIRDGFTKDIFSDILVCIILGVFIGYLAVHLVGEVMKNKYAVKFSGIIESHIEMDELIRFLNENMAYLSPYFHEWGYLKKTMNFGINGIPVVKMDITDASAITLCTEFGEKKSFYAVICIEPDVLSPDSGRKKYFCNVQMRNADIRCEKYACIVKVAPILQAAMEYYLKEYRSEEKEFSAIVPNLETEKKTNYATQQALDNETILDVKSYGDSIKPYYCEQFDRIAHGQKAKFNWAALFLNAWMQLYNGCTGIFCKTFLPFLIVYCLASFIGLLARINYNHTLIVVSSVLGILAGIYGFIMCIINGFCFNKWYYQDVINNPEKRRSRKGFWFLIVAEITMIVILQLTGHLVTKHIMDSFDDYYDELDDDFDNDFYDYSYSDFDDYSIDDADEDWLVEYSEDSDSIQGENIEDSMIDTVQYEEVAREIIIEWFSRHPLQHNFRIEFMNKTANTEDGSGIYLIYEMYWGDDEWYGSFYVNPVSGDMNMDSMIKATGITTVQESMNQWYLEDYWFLGEDLGGYSELYEDNIYFLYNGYNEDGNPILEYYADNDSYRICNYDGQCLIEYDDGSETSEISIMDFAGIYAYDGSFEADDREINFYYLLEIGEWDGYSFSIAETWRGNMLIQDEYARAISLIVDTLTFDIYNPDVGYETHSLTYVPANESTLGKDVIYLDGDNTMPYVRD